MAKPLKSSQKYTYDPRLGAGGMYRNEKGRIVKNSVIRKELERVLQGAKQETVTLAKDLQNGDINLQGWYDGTRQKLKEIHGLSGAIAKGGIERMTPADWGRIGQISRRQYEFLNNFAKQLESGEQALDGRFLRRIQMYVDAGRSTYFEVRRGEAKQAGFAYERRVLNPAEHCDVCIDLASFGWQSIGTLPRIGDSPCRTNCKCEFEFRKTLMNEIVENKSRWSLINILLKGHNNAKKQLGFNR